MWFILTCTLPLHCITLLMVETTGNHRNFKKGAENALVPAALHQPSSCSSPSELPDPGQPCWFMGGISGGWVKPPQANTWVDCLILDAYVSGERSPPTCAQFSLNSARILLSGHKQIQHVAESGEDRRLRMLGSLESWICWAHHWCHMRLSFFYAFVHIPWQQLNPTTQSTVNLVRFCHSDKQGYIYVQIKHV